MLIGFGVFFIGSVWCAVATDLTGLLIGRVIQAAGACATSVLSRAIARDMFSGGVLRPKPGSQAAGLPASAKT